MTPYEILGVSRWNSKDTIKAAYLAMVKVHHPDNGGDEDKIAIINQAYSTLRKKGRV